MKLIHQDDFVPVLGILALVVLLSLTLLLDFASRHLERRCVQGLVLQGVSSEQAEQTCQ